MKECNILGTKVDLINLKNCIEIIEKRIEEEKSLRIVTTNPEIIYQASNDNNYASIINTADLNVPDGIGVVWAVKKLYKVKVQRVTGIDLVQEILKLAAHKGWKIFILGSSPVNVKLAAENILKKYTDIRIEYHHGYFADEREVLEKIRHFNPDILLVGMGAPKQEYWNYQNPNLAYIQIGVGGTIDVLAGKVRRAPAWIRVLGLEWLYRLIREPSRIKRQIKLPLYISKVLRQKDNKSI